MDDIIIRPINNVELNRVSSQIAESYKSAYKNMMSSVYLDTLTDEHWIPLLQNGISRGDTCLIAECGNRIVGSVVYGDSAAGPDGADLHAIYLSPRYIGMGVGHRLYSRMEETMQGQGYKCCTLEVLTDNHRAIRFYQAHGYIITDTFKVQENGMELECHVMKKQLN